MKQKLAEYAKFVAALIGAAATSFAALIPVEWSPLITAVMSFLTAVAVVLVPNRASEGEG